MKNDIKWTAGLLQIIKAMIAVHNEMNPGDKITSDNVEVNYSDSVTNNIGEISGALMQIANSMSASVETRVRLLNPDWSQDQVSAEVEKVMQENGMNAIPVPYVGESPVNQPPTPEDDEE